MNKQAKRQRRRQRYRQWLNGNPEQYESDGQYAILNCKKNPDYMLINYRKGLQPQEDRETYEDSRRFGSYR